MRELLTAVAVIVSVPSFAAADDDDDLESRPSADASSFHALSLRFGDRDVGEISTSTEGAALAIGRRAGRITLYGEADLGYAHGKQLDGVATGLAVHARGEVCGFKMTDSASEMRIPCWVDIGVGWSALFAHDTIVSRPVLSIGIGGGVEAATRRRRGGLLLGLAIELSPVTANARTLATQIRIERSEDPPSAGRHVDAGVMFTMAFLFGR